LPAALRISTGYVGELERGEEKIDDRSGGPVLHAGAATQILGRGEFARRVRDASASRSDGKQRAGRIASGYDPERLKVLRISTGPAGNGTSGDNFPLRDHPQRA